MARCEGLPLSCGSRSKYEADPIKCTACQGPTQSIEMAQPTQDDLLGGAGRVEQHKCANSTCGTIVRFPRYGYAVSFLYSFNLSHLQ